MKGRRARFDEFGEALSDAEPLSTISESAAVASNEERQIEPFAGPFEEREHYADAREAYGDVEVLVEDEDRDEAARPLIEQPTTQRYFNAAALVQYNDAFARDLLANANDHRVVCVLGEHLSGKTTFCDLLLEKSIQFEAKGGGASLCDFWRVEAQRGCSLQPKLFCALHASTAGKTYALQALDTPGHSDFRAEALNCLRVADHVVFVVDAVEGIGANGRAMLDAARRLGTPITVFVNKIDRLIVELKLPPSDAYARLRAVVDECGEASQFAFGSARYKLFFTFETLSAIYFSDLGSLSAERVFWSGACWSAETGFCARGANAFAQFCLLPIYKVFAHAPASDEKQLSTLLEAIGLRISVRTAERTQLPALIALIFENFLFDLPRLVDRIALSRPETTNQRLLAATEPPSLGAVLFAFKAAPETPPSDAPVERLSLWARVLRGEVVSGATLYSSDGATFAAAPSLLAMGDTRFPLSTAGSGALVALGNAAALGFLSERAPLRSRLSAATDGAMRVRVEARLPSEQSTLVAAAALAAKCFPTLSVELDEADALALVGSGETFLDFAIYTLRNVFGAIEVRVAEPSARFCETVSSVSSAISANESVSVFCEPLEAALCLSPIECFERDYSVRTLANGLSNWDALALKSVLCEGTAERPNALLNDVFGESRESAFEQSEALSSAFDWAVGAGPLIEEPIRGVKLRITALNVGERCAAALIADCRRAFHAAVLRAAPRIAEPVYLAEIIARPEALPKCKELLAQRRGQLLGERQLQCTPFVRLQALLPVLDSVGVATDVRLLTLGTARAELSLSGWQSVPGDPLDRKAETALLAAAEPLSLGRDVFLKVRRQKGLANEIE